MKNLQVDFESYIQDNIETHFSLLKISSDIFDVINQIKKRIKKGGKIFFCGNGGSAADAQHLAAEYLVRLRPVNRNPLPAISLAQDTSTLTACGNDYSFNDIFVRPFKALASSNDVLVCITTSGNSKNVLNVLREAKKKIYSVGFETKEGVQRLCSKALIVPSENTARIQECHIFLGHFILEK